jgi:hypothetical protein
MSCPVSTTTAGPCVPCIHPLDYLFEIASLGLTNPNRRGTLAEDLDRILDKGFITTNCNICCSSCNDTWVLASVETFLKYAEAVGITQTAAVPALAYTINGCPDLDPCCSNVAASVETYLKYAEAMGGTASAAVPAGPFPISLVEQAIMENVFTCCNGFNECVDDLFCWITQGVTGPGDVVDRFLDKGIVEYGSITNNCTDASTSSICKFVDLLAEYIPLDKNNRSSKGEIVDRILDKGIVVYCGENGEISIASVETWLKYAEAVGITCSAAVPALSNITTTTTIAEIITETTTNING